MTRSVDERLSLLTLSSYFK
jgi:t-SNARE complex subunit (syntaxin)